MPVDVGPDSASGSKSYQVTDGLLRRPATRRRPDRRVLKRPSRPLRGASENAKSAASRSTISEPTTCQPISC
jgi:hypothetical protein